MNRSIPLRVDSLGLLGIEVQEHLPRGDVYSFHTAVCVRWLQLLDRLGQKPPCLKLGIVNTEGGLVQGVNKRLSLFGDYVDIFKGIPFAATPKPLEDPQLHPGWPGTLEAKEYKPRCLQTTLKQTGVRGSEDCLYLNIWVPQGKKQVSTNLPVMIWIYGGAFIWGGGQGANFLNNYLYDGQEIATRGKVIVVTFNYRLGLLGFLSTGDADLPGNYGLKDQHMAIAWVKRNIKNFGGDPDNITIFGESAGGASVSLQMLSPYNKGLIKRAISQSGVGLCSWAIQKDPLLWASKVAKEVGCPTDNSTVMASCLRASDPKALTLAYSINILTIRYPVVYYLGFSPVVDGDFLPDVPEKLFANAADIDYLAGVNNMDGHMFASVDLPSLNRPLVKITAEQVYNIARALTLEKGVDGANRIFSLYAQLWTDTVSQEVMKRTVIDLETDYMFLIPTQQTVALHHQNAKSGKTYNYLFSQPSRMLIYPSWVGADHADDLQYVFGKPFVTPLGYRPQHRKLSKAMIAYWTNFASTGNPNQGELSVPIGWVPYDALHHYYLEINKEINNDSMKQNLRGQYVQYWSTTYRRLPDVPFTLDL